MGALCGGRARKRSGRRVSKWYHSNGYVGSSADTLGAVRSSVWPRRRLSMHLGYALLLGMAALPGAMLARRQSL